MNYITKFDGEAVGRYVRYQTPTGTPDGTTNKDGTYCANIAEIALYGEKKEVAPKEVLGDVDGNGEFRGKRPRPAQQKFLLGSGTLVKWKNGDFNNDDRVDTFDLILMRQHIVPATDTIKKESSPASDRRCFFCRCISAATAAVVVVAAVTAAAAAAVGEEKDEDEDEKDDPHTVVSFKA